MATSNSYWNLLWEMTRCEFKLRDQGTFLGFLWTLISPAVMFLVLHELFTKWMGRFVENYAFYLLIGLLQWGFFANATSNALTSLQRKAGMIQNFKFPREVVIFSSVGVILWSHLLEILVMVALVFFFAKTLAWTWLYLPILVGIEALWVLAVSFFLARFAVEYRDIERAWGILMHAGFFLVPVFYPLQIIAEGKRFWLLLNPIVHIMDGMRACLLRSQVPPLWIVLALIFGGLFLTHLGLRWFRSREGTIVDHL